MRLIGLLLALLLMCGGAQANSTVPEWALNPQKEGYLTGVGVAKLKPNKKNAEMFRDRAAKLMAEAELSKQISIHINSQTSSARSSDGSMGIRVDSVQTSITTLNTNEAEVIQQWIDPKSGTLYLMLGIELAKVGL